LRKKVGTTADRSFREDSMLRKILGGVLAAALFAAPAMAGDSEACRKVRLSDVGWTDITATTAVTSVLLEALGYQPEVQVLSVPVTYQSLQNKDIDVFLGNWMPSMAADVKPFTDAKTVEVLAQNLEGAGYGLVVPDYVYDGGVKSLKDIGKFKDKFAGNDGNRIVLGMIANKDNGLDGFELVESSEAGMLAQAEKVMKDQDWIVFLGWTPHPVMGNMKIKYLEGMGDSGFGAAKVFTNVRAGYAKECPNVGKFIGNLKFDLPMENELMDQILKGKDAKDAATEWLKAHPDAATPWLNGITTFDGGDAAAAVKKTLGS
jgi:glycine betaine/proline transport system substrate-binding protein